MDEWLPIGTRVLVSVVDDIDGPIETVGGVVLDQSSFSAVDIPGWRRYRIQTEDGHELLS